MFKSDLLAQNALIHISFCSNHGVNGFCRAEFSVHISYKLVLHRPEFPYKMEFLLDGIQSNLSKNTYVGLTKTHEDQKAPSLITEVLDGVEQISLLPLSLMGWSASQACDAVESAS